MIEPLNPDEAAPQARELLARLRRENGMLPNAFRVMARAPALLDGYVQFAGSLKLGALEARQRELIALRVATLNGCAYCLAAHRVAARFARLSAIDIAEAEAGRAEDATDACLLALVDAIVATRGELEPTQLQAAREIGFDDGRLLEITGHVALNTLTNMVNRLARTPVDFGRTVRLATEVLVRLGRDAPG